METLAIEFLTVYGLPPVEFVDLAADLGCRHISTGLMPPPYNPYHHPAWSLRDDAMLRRNLMAAMRDRGVSIALGEGFSIRADVDVSARAGDLAVFRELGVTRINTVAMDPDLHRCIDQIGALVEMATAADMETTLEFMPVSVIGNLTAALAVIQQVGSPDLRLLIDTMHFFRSGSRLEDLATVDPDRLGYVQLCDAPLSPANPDYMEEAMFERLPPGAGELPLHDLLQVLPHNLVISLEVPQRAQVAAGTSPRQWAVRCVEAARDLLQQLPENS